MGQLEKTTTLELLIELMYEGRSGLIDRLKENEPIPVPSLLEVLRARAQRDVGLGFADWYEWFEKEAAEATPEERDILKNLHDFKTKTDKLIRRIRDDPKRAR
jgi:hypothetical protein